MLTLARRLTVVVLPTLVATGVAAQRTRTAHATVDALLSADRAYAAAAATRPVAEALGAMFAPNVWMQTPSGFVAGRDSVLAALERNAANAVGRLAWRPIRGGISADGTHGFTFGYMTLSRPDSASVALKYMSYWIRGPEGWRVAVYKRGASTAGPRDTTVWEPSLPARWWRPLSNARSAARDLTAAESAFSALAGRVGLKEAFRRTGAPDAVNMGGPGSPSFVRGPEAIADIVGQGEPPGGSALSWASDRVLVASSGDLGVSIGTILAPASGGSRRRIPFFTIWRRSSATTPWRYVAE
jgi:ketosteroid isomerase-like protein